MRQANAFNGVLNPMPEDDFGVADLDCPWVPHDGNEGRNADRFHNLLVDAEALVVSVQILWHPKM